MITGFLEYSLDTEVMLFVAKETTGSLFFYQRATLLARIANIP